MGIFNENKTKEPKQENEVKKPIYTKLSTMNKENNNNNPFGSEKSLLQKQMNQSNLDEIRKKVEETKDTMNKNIEELKKRAENLDSLEGKAYKINKSSEQFKRNTKKTNKALRYENLKLKIFAYTTCFLIAFFCTYAAFFAKEQRPVFKVLELSLACLSTLCIGYLAVNDCRNVINFDLCLKKISCCNKDNKQEEGLQNIV